MSNLMVSFARELDTPRGQLHLWLVEDLDTGLKEEILLWPEEQGTNPGARHNIVLAKFRALKAFLLEY